MIWTDTPCWITCWNDSNTYIQALRNLGYRITPQREMIIEALALEDVAPENIESTAALFVEGLGLDSIDALELAMALEERYGVRIGDDHAHVRRVDAGGNQARQNRGEQGSRAVRCAFRHGDHRGFCLQHPFLVSWRQHVRSLSLLKV